MADHRPATTVMRRALLGNLHDAGLAIGAAVGQGRSAFFSAPGLCAHVLECLELMRDSARDMPAADKAALSHIDWAALEALPTRQQGPPHEWRERLWQIASTLVPTTAAATVDAPTAPRPTTVVPPRPWAD